MSKKKESRKAKSDNEIVQEFFELLGQYEVSERFLSPSASFFPNLPQRFSLKLGEAIVGDAFIDWKAVMVRLSEVEAAMVQPDEVSDREYRELLRNSFASASPQEQRAYPYPFYLRILHTILFLPEKLNTALLHLCLESRKNFIMQQEKKRGSKTTLSAAGFAELMATFDAEAIKKRLPEARGGSKPGIEVSDDQCVQLSADYPVLLQHWHDVKSWHKKRENWRDHAKLDQPDTPDDLLDKLSGLDHYERQPSALAHEHAARRHGIPANTYSLSSLSRLRRRGDKIHGQSKSHE